jgi:archaellum component FlaG (FlaF/FlaG flagellin family)
MIELTHKDIDYLHHTRCSSFYLKQIDRFEIMFDPDNLQVIDNDDKYTMLWCDRYLEARLIQNWYSSLYSKNKGMVMYDLASEDYCVLINSEYIALDRVINLDVVV